MTLIAAIVSEELSDVSAFASNMQGGVLSDREWVLSGWYMHWTRRKASWVKDKEEYIVGGIVAIGIGPTRDHAK